MNEEDRTVDEKRKDEGVRMTVNEREGKNRQRKREEKRQTREEEHAEREAAENISASVSILIPLEVKVI